MEKSGTTITIRRLTDEVKARLSDPTLTHDLHSAISKTYLLFLGKVVNVDLERIRVVPWSIPIAESEEITPAHRDYSMKYKEGTVATKIIASLAMRGSRNEWTYDRAGWYVFCNNRAVLTADKSELTGWGATGLPRYHSKYNGFIGLIFFQSSNPVLLPWKTTKRGVNPDSLIYQKMRPEMSAVARPIISFLNEMYPSEIPEELPQRAIAEGVRAVDVRKFARQAKGDFNVIPRSPRRTPGATVSIQFNAKRADVERIKKAIRQPSWSASRVGEYAFEYLIKNELTE